MIGEVIFIHEHFVQVGVLLRLLDFSVTYTLAQIRSACTNQNVHILTAKKWELLIHYHAISLK